MKALLLVDIQNDFLPGGALGVKGGDEIIPVVNELLKQDFDVIVASKDWHPSNHISFAENHGKEPGEVIEVEGGEQELWPVHCVQDSLGAQFAPDLQTAAIEKVFYKGVDTAVDSYSAFFDNNRQRSTGLSDYLRSRGVESLVIAGLATDYCVKFSVIDAIDEGFDVSVIVEGCRGVNLHPGDVDKALEIMRSAGAEIIDSE